MHDSCSKHGHTNAARDRLQIVDWHTGSTSRSRRKDRSRSQHAPAGQGMQTSSSRDMARIALLMSTPGVNRFGLPTSSKGYFGPTPEARSCSMSAA